MLHKWICSAPPRAAGRSFDYIREFRRSSGTWHRTQPMLPNDGVLRPAHRQLSPLRPAAEAGHVPCPAVGPTPPSPGPLRITSATTVLFYWDWRSLKGTVWNPLFIVVCWWLWVTVSFYFFGGSFCTTRDGSVGKDGLLTPFLYVL